MAEGIRVRHHTRRSSIVTVPMLTLPLKGVRTVVCPFCAQVHLCKTVHLVVDAEGTSIISHKTWELIKGHAPEDGGFVAANPVADPPTQNMAPPTAQQRVKVFDIDDGVNPVHTVDIEDAVKHLLIEVPEATEAQVLAFLVAKLAEQGPDVSER